MCCGRVLVENGFRVCTECGRGIGRHLETSLTAFDQSSLYFPHGYSRKSRFEKKVLGALRCISAHKVDEQLMKYLRTRNVTTPQELLHEMSKYPTSMRRPYIYIMYYWKALGFKQPVVCERDMDILKREFDHIFFAWERLSFENPKFPYAYTFQKLVTGQLKYSNGMRALVPFVRTLRCKKRRKRYDRLFAICREFDFKKIVFKQKQMDPEIEYPKTIAYAHEVVSKPHQINVYDVKRVYKTQTEVDDAFRNKTFDASKTMHIGADGKFYFLQWQETNLVKRTIRDEQFETQQKKLEEMLREQAGL